MAEQQEPGWKRFGRNGPLDWWLACKDHGYDYAKGCLSCSMAEDHNIEFQAKLDREQVGDGAAVPAAPSTRTPGFDAATPTGRPRPSKEWYAAKIAETLDDDFTVGPPATPEAAQQPVNELKLHNLANEIRSYVKADWRATLEMMSEWADAISESLATPPASTTGAGVGGEVQPSEPIAICTGDHVHHTPSGEDWVVAYVQGDKLCACGWPETLADLSDCTLIRRATVLEAAELMFEMSRGGGTRAAYARDELVKFRALVSAHVVVQPAAGQGGQT